MWTDKYIGLRFAPNGRDYSGVDCWGLVWLVYRHEYGIDLPIYDGVYMDNSIESIQGAHTHIETVQGRFETVETPSEGDIILIRAFGSLISHVGLYTGNKMMLHVMAGINSTVEKISGSRWKDRIAGYRRHVDHS